MKCTAKLIYYKKLTKTGKRKLFTSLPYDWDITNFALSLKQKQYLSVDWESVEKCGGNIVSNLGCHFEEEEWAEFDVNFICDKCGQHNHPNLPREEFSLNEWLTKIIAELP